MPLTPECPRFVHVRTGKEVGIVGQYHNNFIDETTIVFRVVETPEQTRVMPETEFNQQFAPRRATDDTIGAGIT
jgi:hypothetical protein